MYRTPLTLSINRLRNRQFPVDSHTRKVESNGGCSGTISQPLCYSANARCTDWARGANAVVSICTEGLNLLTCDAGVAGLRVGSRREVGGVRCRLPPRGFEGRSRSLESTVLCVRRGATEGTQVVTDLGIHGIFTKEATIGHDAR